MVSLLADFGIHFPIALSAAPGTKFVNLTDSAVSQLDNMRIGGTILDPTPGFCVLTNELA
jgi:hypothetical protein